MTTITEPKWNEQNWKYNGYTEGERVVAAQVFKKAMDSPDFAHFYEKTNGVINRCTPARNAYALVICFDDLTIPLNWIKRLGWTEKQDSLTKAFQRDVYVNPGNPVQFTKAGNAFIVSIIATTITG